MSDVVAQQYEEWVYPEPIEDMAAAVAVDGYRQIGDPLEHWPLYWPRGRACGPLDILVAGCGSNQAAYYALRHPASQVVGVDVSRASLAHSEYLKDKHGLDNLTLVQMDLTRVADLGLEFDFITSTGVLHHLADPVAGLAALGSVLRPRGVASLMVYGTSLRLGVYLLQDVFRTLGMSRSTEDIALVRAVVRSLPTDHALKRYLGAADDLDFDAGIVDTFLHGRDRSYTVDEVYELAHDADLEFLTWVDPLEYSLEAHVPASHPIWPKLVDLTPRHAAHVCDFLTQSRGTHRFVVAHPSYVREYEQVVGDIEACAYVLRPGATVVEDRDGVVIERRGRRVTVDPDVARLVASSADEAQSLRDRADAADLSDARVSQLTPALRSLVAQGHLLALRRG